MPREVIEWRAVGVDIQDGEEYREAEAWTEDRENAERDLAELRAHSPVLSFDKTFLKRRVTVFGEPERVEEDEGHQPSDADIDRLCDAALKAMGPVERGEDGGA